MKPFIFRSTYLVGLLMLLHCAACSESQSGRSAPPISTDSATTLAISHLPGMSYKHKIEDLVSGRRMVTIEFYKASADRLANVTLNYKLYSETPQQWKSKAATCSGNSVHNCWVDFWMNKDGDYVQYNFSFEKNGTKFETKDYYDSNSPQWVRDGNSGSFTDDFDGNAIDQAKWRGQWDGAPPNEEEVQCYVPLNHPGQQVAKVHFDEVNGYEGRKKQVRYGLLRGFHTEHQPLPEECKWKEGKITGKEEDKIANIKSFFSGKIMSHQAFTHGRFEIRARIPTSWGTFPAIWLLPLKDGAYWPGVGELDILEAMGAHNPYKFNSTIIYHEGYNAGGKTSKGEGAKPAHRRTTKDMGVKLSDDFHVYVMEWTAEAISFFVDGALIKTFNKHEMGRQHFATAAEDWAHPYVSPACVGGTSCWPYDNHPMNLIINLALVKTSNGTVKDSPPDPNALHDHNQGQMQIDYVHVYRHR